MQTALVGGLAAIGVFLLSYQGYPKKPGDPLLSDFWASTLAGLGALGVALFPTAAPGPLDCPKGSAPEAPQVAATVIQGFTGHPGWLHVAAAVLFFGAVTYMCVFLFPKGAGRWHISVFKQPENAAYALCGALMAIACIGLLFVVHNDCAARWNAVFWFETLGITAFAAAWLIKGRAILGLRQMFRPASR